MGRFEKFASQFLVSELPDFARRLPVWRRRTRFELFSPTGDATHVLQYSVAEDWREKIRRTAKRVRETMPSAQLLTYVTNRPVGADADELKQELVRSTSCISMYVIAATSLIGYSETRAPKLQPSL